MTTPVHAKVFWSGGSQAVRLPRELRVEGTEVLIRRRGRAILIEPALEEEGWGGFWERLVSLKEPVRRGKTKPAERRRPV
jgi:antitoxin VapB